MLTLPSMKSDLAYEHRVLIYDLNCSICPYGKYKVRDNYYDDFGSAFAEAVIGTAGIYRFCLFIEGQPISLKEITDNVCVFWGKSVPSDEGEFIEINDISELQVCQTVQKK